MNLKTLILERINNTHELKVWTAIDFLDLGNRDAVDKVLQRLVNSNQLRRIDRGLYDIPKINNLMGTAVAPDYRKIIAAIARRDQARILIDGLTSANDLGLTNAVPAQINILTDCRLKSIKIQNLIINFKHTAPSKLYWADRPAMRIVQSLHWLRDILNSGNDLERKKIKEKIIWLLHKSKQKKILLNDLHKGLTTLPSWMQEFLKEVFTEANKK